MTNNLLSTLTFLFLLYAPFLGKAQFQTKILDTIHFGQTINKSPIANFKDRIISFRVNKREWYEGLDSHKYINMQLCAVDLKGNYNVLRSWDRKDSVIRYFDIPVAKSDSAIYFLQSSTYVTDLWQTDGTKLGTKKLLRLRHPAPANYHDSSGRSFQAVSSHSLELLENKLYFYVANPDSFTFNHLGRDVYVYDLKTGKHGFTGGTLFPARKITSFSNNINLAQFNNQKYYLCNDDIYSAHQLTTGNAKIDNRGFEFVELNGVLYAYYVTNTPDSTYLYQCSPKSVTDTLMNLVWAGKGWHYKPIESKNLLTKTGSVEGLEIKGGNYKLVKHNLYIPESYRDEYDSISMLNNGKFLIDIESSQYGREPYVTDFTQQGTFQLVDAVKGKYGRQTSGLLNFGHTIFFGAGYGDYFLTDGTISGTHRLPNHLYAHYRDAFFEQLPIICEKQNDSIVFLVSVKENGVPIKGLVFNDLNGNGQRDNGENGLFNQTIVLQPGNVTVGTDNKGLISGYVKNQNTVAGLVVPKNWKLTTPDSTFNLKKDSLNLTRLVFGIQASKNQLKLDADIAINRTHCARGKGGVYINNKSTKSITPLVYLTLHPSCSLTRAKTKYTVGIDNVVTLTADKMAPFTSQYIWFEYRLTGIGENDTIMHQMVTMVDTMKWTDTVEYVTTCSYDPNDKAVSPIPHKGENGVKLNPQDELKYIIRFQNVGNDTAFDVTVYDTLDAGLNHESLRVIGSSHDMGYTFDGNVVKFHFKNIYLPDSSANEPASNGHLVFAIKPLPNYSHKTLVHNKAGIVFDINSPIITNKVETQLVKSLKIKAAVLTSAKYINNNTVRVEWTNIANNADSLILERSMDDTLNFNPIFKTDKKPTYYEDGMVDKASKYFYRLRVFNSYEGSVSNIDSAVFSVGKTQLIRSLIIYPNPVRDELNIKGTKGMKILSFYMYDMKGRLVSTGNESKTTHTLNVSHLKNGSYQLKVVTEKGTHSQMIQIE